MSWFSPGQQQRTTPPLAGVGWRMGRKGKTPGSGWGQFNRTAKETTAIPIRRLYKKVRGIDRATLSPPDAQRAPKPQLSSPTQNPAWQHMVSSTPFVWPVWVSLPGCVPSWLLVKIVLSWPNPGQCAVSVSPNHNWLLRMFYFIWVIKMALYLKVKNRWDVCSCLIQNLICGILFLVCFICFWGDGVLFFSISTRHFRLETKPCKQVF